MTGFCAVPDAITSEANRAMSHWRRGMPVRWTVDKAPAGWSVLGWTDICLASFTAWNAVSGTRFTMAKPSERVNVIVTTRRIDGPAGVLAEAEIPPDDAGEHVTTRAWFDLGDSFVNAINPAPGKIDCITVGSHEFGHTAGIGHAPQGEQDLMGAYYSPGLRAPGQWSTYHAVTRYGLPSLKPPITPTDPDGTEDAFSGLVARIARALLNDPDLRKFVNERLG